MDGTWLKRKVFKYPVSWDLVWTLLTFILYVDADCPLPSEGKSNRKKDAWILRRLDKFRLMAEGTVVDIVVVDIEEEEDIVAAVAAVAVVVAVEEGEDLGEDTQAITEETISGYAF